MPVVFTFDVAGSPTVGSQSLQNRVQCAFQRLGWQHLGGTAYRYPAFGTTHNAEDWFNHVIPALMLFRSMSQHHNIVVSKFTIDAQSSTGHDLNAGVGTPIQTGTQVQLYAPNNSNHFGMSNLQQWIDSVTSPY